MLAILCSYMPFEHAKFYTKGWHMHSIFSFAGLRKQRWGWALAALCTAAVIVACGGGGGDSGSAGPAATVVTGLVQNAANLPVPGAKVSLTAGQSAMTDADGRFSITAQATSTVTVALVSKAGHATNAKEVPVTAGKTTDLTIKLFKDETTTSFSATVGGTVTLALGASAQIGANAVQDASGNPFNGTVMAAASYFGPDTLQGVQAFPAPYAGSDAGAQSPLITVGVMEVKLTDSAGNALQLRPTSPPATLTFPASSTSANTATVPLWYYDESAKNWVREGQVTRQTNGSYQGTVKHFSLWNVDFKGVTATIKGCFRDAANNPVTDVGPVGLRGNGWQSTVAGYNPPDGNFTVLNVPANIPLEMYSRISPAGFATLAIPALTPGEVRQLACQTATAITNTSVLVITTPPGLFTTTAGSFAGNYAGTYSGAESGTFTVAISANGDVVGQGYSTTYQFSFAVTGKVGASGNVTLLAAGQAGNSTFAGSITPLGAVSGTWSYVAPAIGTGTFTGKRIP